MEKIITKNESSIDITKVTANFEKYLDSLGLPSSDIFASEAQRVRIFTNFGAVIQSILPDQKKEAYYVSKYFGAAIIGLFDAALNYLWNAIIENLREKVNKFDIAYFFDSHQSQSLKSNPKKNRDELNKILDKDLIEGCLNIGIISNIVYQRLTHIQYMRNHASAAHPHTHDITGLNLVDWLDFAITDIFNKDFPTSVITQGRIIRNIKQGSPINSTDVAYINSSLDSLKTEYIDSLLSALFGIYVDGDSNSTVRNNVLLLIEPVWNKASEKPKNQIGINFANYSLNLDTNKKALTRIFLEKVKGLAYLPEDYKIAELDTSLELLHNAHYEMNNFYNEPPHIKNIALYINNKGTIPSQIKYKFVKVIVNCRIGNGYGVSLIALDYYDKMISAFENEEIKIFCELIRDDDFISKFGNRKCSGIFIGLAEELKKRATGQTLECIEYIIDQKDALDTLSNATKYKELIGKL